MSSKQPTKKLRPEDRGPLRGISTVTFVGVTASVLFLATMGCSVWWAFRARRAFSQSANTQRIRSIAESLVQTSEALLVADEVSTLRRIIAESRMDNNFESLRIVLPDGNIIAAGDPSAISLPKLPPRWSGTVGEYRESSSAGLISLAWPLDVPNRGRAMLELRAGVLGSVEADLVAQSGLGMIVAFALAGLLLIHRSARIRLRAIGAVQEALLAVERGSNRAEVLRVSDNLGPEATAWNKLLTEKEQLKNQIVLEQAKDSLQSRSAETRDLGTVCDALPQGLILVDRDNRPRYANGAAAALLQTRREEILNSDLSDLVKDQGVLDGVRVAITQRKRTAVEIEQEGAGAGVLRFLIRPARRGDAGAAMIIIEDITQKRVAEESRGVFLAQATHELRTPLSNIRMYVETALEEGKDDPQVTAKSLNVINEESRRLERMVSDILSVSEIEAGTFKIQRDDVRFDVLLEGLAADYEPQAKEKQISLVFELPPKLPVLQADRDKIAIALQNLMGNALKYTPPGGRVTVSASQENTHLVFEVSDTGIGISDDEAEKIFEKFYRARNARSVDIEGSGMGLALAREIARLHGGDITVQSEPDRGSTFSLSLPISEKAA